MYVVRKSLYIIWLLVFIIFCPNNLYNRSVDIAQTNCIRPHNYLQMPVWNDHGIPLKYVF